MNQELLIAVELKEKNTESKLIDKGANINVQDENDRSHYVSYV